MSRASDSFNPSRRRFLRNTSLSMGAGLALGVTLPGCGGETSEANSKHAADEFRPSIWLRISSNNQVTITLAETEMGQGVMTAIPMLIAEELDADWDQVVVEQAPVEPAFGFQVTGGSSSIRQAWRPLREVGATAREALLQAAAELWSVNPDSCGTEPGMVLHLASGRSLAYGALTALASARPLPDKVRLKKPAQFRLLGTALPSKGLEAKVQGGARYGMDQTPPGLLIALIARAPILGARLTGFDASVSARIPGIRKIFAVDSGVAVVADGFWEAQQARDALTVEWQQDRLSAPDSQRMSALFAASLPGPGEPDEQRGEPLAVFGQTAGLQEALYELPLQAHATFEPMNCTAWFHDGICEVWAPTQAPTQARDLARDLALSAAERLWHKAELRLTGSRSDPVLLHPTLMGGGFGRRLHNDYVTEAVQIAKQISGPVKVIWSREDDFRHDHFRPASLQRLRAVLDQHGLPKAWHHRVVSTDSSTSGAKGLEYAIPHVLVDKITVKVPGLRTGPWRSVAHSYTAFAVESFIDELARTAGTDPYRYRRQLLGHSPRHLGVLDAAATAAGWDGPRSDHDGNRYLGLAVHKSFETYVCQVAEVFADGANPPRLTRVVCAIDCGQVVHPDTVRAQVEGSIIFALNTVLKSSITLRDGAVEQTNYHQFELLRMDETPAIEVILIAGADAPGGVGEPAVPPLAPAVANALFAATGKRYRSLPVGANVLRSGRA